MARKMAKKANVNVFASKNVCETFIVNVYRMLLDSIDDGCTVYEIVFGDILSEQDTQYLNSYLKKNANLKCKEGCEDLLDYVLKGIAEIMNDYSRKGLCYDDFNLVAAEIHFEAYDGSIIARNLSQDWCSFDMDDFIASCKEAA